MSRREKERKKGDGFMIRGIDSQIMIQRSVDTARIAGEQLHNIEQQEDFKAMAERERIAREANQVQSTEKAEHRRINEDDEEQQGKEDYPFQYHHDADKDEEQEEMSEVEEKAAEKMKKISVGSELDISV